MNLDIIVPWFVFAIILAAIYRREVVRRKRKASQPSLSPIIEPRGFQPPQARPIGPRPTEPLIQRDELLPSSSQQFTTKKGKVFIDFWQKSIVGLIRLANTNLMSARTWLSIANYDLAIRDAAIAVENIARALLYCFGEKPEPNPGQQEALKLLIRRLNDDEKSWFQMTVETIDKISQNRIVAKYVSTSKVALQVFNESYTKEIVDCASTVITRFKKLIVKRFAHEIPELCEEPLECPKCHSLSTCMLAFDETNAYCECYECKNKWTEPRWPKTK
ncbi:MAG: HEPN domain-containing protein [Candidatus Bathyarchaeia archaeon]